MNHIKNRRPNSARPNTLLPVGLLRADAILCCGEDLGEFIDAIRSAFGKPRTIHRYRCYAFLEVRGVSFIWTGIGTGCIEPLICEVRDEPRLSRIILVGTAGSVAGRAKLGAATPIREAQIACAGISPKQKILKSNWPIAKNTAIQRIVSTDYYYGFTLKRLGPTPQLWAADTRLANSVAKALRRADLVDMETGQFYHLCQTLRPDWQFLAIKGAANPLTDFTQQTFHSESVLKHAITRAKGFLQNV